MNPVGPTQLPDGLPDASLVVDQKQILEQELENLTNIHKDLEGEILTMLVKRGRIEALIGAISDSLGLNAEAEESADVVPFAEGEG